MFITQQDFDFANAYKERSPWSIYYQAVLSLADRLLEIPAPRVDHSRHNWILEQAKCFGRYAITLAGAYRLTGNAAYAGRCCRLIDDALEWETWYWEDESSGGYGYDLATGEMAYFFSMLLYLLADRLKPEQRAGICTVLKERVLDRYLKASGDNNRQGKPAHWYTGRTNWNAVCNGGMLCLAFCMAEQCPAYKEVIPRALKGLDSYLDALQEDGSSIEGIGYWSYGVTFMTYALLDYEVYYGKSHPVFERNVFREGLSFPFDFSPQGAGISFGDVNHFTPSPLVYRLAQKAGREDLEQEVTMRLLMEASDFAATGTLSCNFAERELYALLLCKRETALPEPKETAHCKVYPDNGWMLFASGALRLSFRSGSTDMPHAVKDLNAVQLAKNGTRLLESIVNSPYTLGWFTPGRELYAENQTTSKNAILINGGGQLYYAAADWHRHGNSVSSDAQAAYPEYVRNAARTVSADATEILIKDQIETEAGAWHEVRYITKGEFIKFGDGQYKVSCSGEECLMTFQADCRLEFYTAPLVNSIAGRESANMLRVVSKEAVQKSEIRTRLQSEYDPNQNDGK